MATQINQNNPQQTADKSKIVDMSVVLVCWNNKNYLGPCLESLYNAGLNHAFDVIVVDNGSTDGSQEMLHEKFPEVKLIENGRNVGLSKASNQGIEGTDGKYVLLLNNDTIVNGKALNAFVDFLDTHPEAGGVGGKLLYEDGSFQAGYAKFSDLKEEFLLVMGLGYPLWKGYPSHYDSDHPVQAGWLSSACLLLRRSALDQVGLLDEEYFIYGDETDLQYRLYRAGWKVYYLPDATTLHYGGRSMNRWNRRKRIYRGKLLFYKKNYGWFLTTILRLMVGVISFVKVLICLVLLLVPKMRETAKLALRSNWDIIKLCWKIA